MTYLIQSLHSHPLPVIGLGSSDLLHFHQLRGRPVCHLVLGASPDGPSVEPPTEPLTAAVRTVSVIRRRFLLHVDELVLHSVLVECFHLHGDDLRLSAVPHPEECLELSAVVQCSNNQNNNSVTIGQMIAFFEASVCCPCPADIFIPTIGYRLWRQVGCELQ